MNTLRLTSIYNTYLKTKLQQPSHYFVVDAFLSRSAQPKTKGEFIWLKEQGVGDILSFRNQKIQDLEINEPKILKQLGINYGNFPLIVNKFDEPTVIKILEKIDKAKGIYNNKAHGHCLYGQERTGLIAALYKTICKQGTFDENIEELERLCSFKPAPLELIDSAKRFVEKFR